jgi:hypothetical protein
MHVAMSPTTAAGEPPINTVGTPGPVIGPPRCGVSPVNIGHVCMSPIRAAGLLMVFDLGVRTTDFAIIRQENNHLGT